MVLEIAVLMMPAAQSFNGIPLVQLQLARDEQRLADFVNAMSAAVFITDEKGTPVHSNAHARKLLGEGIGGNGQAAGGEVYEAYVAGSIEPYPAERSPVARALQGISSLVDDMEVQGPEGRIPLEVHGAPLLDARGKVVLAIALFRDITPRKQLAARQLISERLASFAALAAGVSHDINNPLTVVISNLVFALEELDAGIGTVEAVTEALKEARAGTERIRLRVRDLRIFSKHTEDKPKPTDVLELLGSALGLAYSQIAHRATLVKSLEPVPRVLASEAELGHLFFSLLSSAAQAIPEGLIADHQLQVTTQRDARGRAVIDVAHTGPGISREVLPLIFSPFFTTWMHEGSCGVGLTICQGIVQRLGGELTVATQLGQGTTFRVALPGCAAVS